MPGMTRDIAKGSPLHTKLVTMLSTRLRFAERAHAKNVDTWQKAEERALAYIPEQEVDALRRSDRDRGVPRYTTIQIPYTYALLMAAHTYWTSVFFARSPVHQFAGRHGETEQQVQCMEALISYQVEVGEALAPYYIWLYDAAKYGMGVLGIYWDDEKIQYSQIVEQVDPLTGKSSKVHETYQVPGYKGNRVYNVSPFDFFHDPRYPIGRFQEGEFCAVRKVMGWNECVRRREQGYYMNTEFITNKSAPDKLTMGSSALLRPELPGFMTDNEQEHPQSFYMYEVYVDLIQNEWDLGDSKYPEKWVFTITGDLSLVIGAQPLGAMHGKFPFDVSVPEVEGYGIFPRGYPEIMSPIQNTMDWLINTHFYNVRAAMNNQFIIDPSKIVIRDAEDGGPGFIYRLRPEAYGTDVRSFFYQVPVTDFTAGHVNDMNTMFSLGEKVSGINDSMFGAIASGGQGSRKTATEIRTSTGFGVNRQKTITEYISARSFSPHAQKLIQQTQQWYDTPTKVRIVGDLAQTYGTNFLTVNPESIAGFYDFVPVDGTLPIDRMAMANLWQQIMGQMRNFPQLMQQFDLSRIFGHIANLGGIRNVNQFRVQVAEPGQLAQQAQMGNVIPLRAGGSGVATPSGSQGPTPSMPLPGSDVGSQSGAADGSPFPQ